MIRTVIQQKQSFTITLPKKWVKKNNLTNKSEVNIEEDIYSNKLLISPINNENTNNKQRITINAKGLELKAIRIILNENYRLGFDVIKILSVEKEELPKLEELNKKLIGFTSTTTNKSITFETLTQDHIEKNTLNNIIRKIFTIIKETYTEEKEYLENLKFNCDINTNYARRILNKFYKGEQNAFHYYNLITKLSLLQHAIYETRKETTDEETKHILEKIKKEFEIIETSLFKEKYSELNKIYSLKKEITKQINEYGKKTKSKNIDKLYEQNRLLEILTGPIQGLIIIKQGLEENK